MRFPPLDFKIMLESNPLKFRILVRRLAVAAATRKHDINKTTLLLSCLLLLLTAPAADDPHPIKGYLLAAQALGHASA